MRIPLAVYESHGHGTDRLCVALHSKWLGEQKLAAKRGDRATLKPGAEKRAHRNRDIGGLEIRPGSGIKVKNRLRDLSRGAVTGDGHGKTACGPRGLRGIQERRRWIDTKLAAGNRRRSHIDTRGFQM